MCIENLMELEAQRKDKERQEEEEVTEELKRFTMQEMARGLSLSDEALVSFWGTGAKQRTAHKGYSRCSECNPVLLCHLWSGEKREREPLPRPNKTLGATGPRERSDLHKKLCQTCLWVFESLLRRHGSAVACHKDKGSNCSSPLKGTACGISPLGVYH